MEILQTLLTIMVVVAAATAGGSLAANLICFMIDSNDTDMIYRTMYAFAVSFSVAFAAGFVKAMLNIFA